MLLLFFLTTSTTTATTSGYKNDDKDDNDNDSINNDDFNYNVDDDDAVLGEFKPMKSEQNFGSSFTFFSFFRRLSNPGKCHYTEKATSSRLRDLSGFQNKNLAVIVQVLAETEACFILKIIELAWPGLNCYHVSRVTLSSDCG